MFLLTTQFVSSLSLLGRYSECLWGFPVGSMGKESSCNAGGGGRHKFDPRVGKIPWRRAWQLQCSCLENSMNRGAWWATVHGVEKSQTHLKWLSTPKGCFCPTCLLPDYSPWLLGRGMRIWGIKVAPFRVWRQGTIMWKGATSPGFCQQWTWTPFWHGPFWWDCAFSSLFLLFSQSVVSNSLRPHRL